MSFEDRVAAVDIATRFQECSNEVFKMVDEETDSGKTQVFCAEKKTCTPGIGHQVALEDYDN